jgi:hypothetical protein
MGGDAPRSSRLGEEDISSPGRSPVQLTAKSTLYLKGLNFEESTPRGPPLPGGAVVAIRGRGGSSLDQCPRQRSATDCLGQFWKAEVGNFSQAPKVNHLRGFPIPSKPSIFL